MSLLSSVWVVEVRRFGHVAFGAVPSSGPRGAWPSPWGLVVGGLHLHRLGPPRAADSVGVFGCRGGDVSARVSVR